MTSPGDVPYMGVGGGGNQPRGERGWGEDLSNENLCQGVLHLNSTACGAAVPSLPAAHTHPLGQRSLPRWLTSPAPRTRNESSTSWREAGAQGLSSGICNYQDRDPPTQYSNLYTYLEAPALPLGRHPWGRGGARGERVGQRGPLPDG